MSFLGISSNRSGLSGIWCKWPGQLLNGGQSPHTSMCMTFTNWQQYKVHVFMTLSPFLSNNTVQLSRPSTRIGGVKSQNRQSITMLVVWSIIELQTIMYAKGVIFLRNECNPKRKLTVFLPNSMGMLPPKPSWVACGTSSECLLGVRMKWHKIPFKSTT